MTSDTPRKLILRVMGRLEDEGLVFTSMDDLIEAYNDAMDEISDATEFYERHVTVTRKKWSLYTDLRGALPEDVLRVTAVWNPTTAKWLAPTTPKEIDDSVGRGWERNVDRTRWWFMRGLWHLAAYPVSGDDVSPLRIYYSSTFRHISADGGLSLGLDSEFPLPPDYNNGIEAYMLSAILTERGETDKSTAWYAEYKQAEAKLMAAADRRLMRDRTPRMGARRKSGAPT